MNFQLTEEQNLIRETSVPMPKTNWPHQPRSVTKRSALIERRCLMDWPSWA